jgi:hypothetical protein
LSALKTAVAAAESEPLDLSGRGALVTGASGGFGQAAPRALGVAGAEVALAAGSVAFPSAPASDFITGQVSYVDPGYTAS